MSLQDFALNAFVAFAIIGGLIFVMKNRHQENETHREAEREKKEHM